MDDRDWLILKVLHEKQNITKAAQSLFISQPSLTKRIQHIEQEFKVTLVQRGTRGVHFTPQGEFLAKCADEMLERMRQIKESALNMEHEVMGTLRLAVSNYTSRQVLPRLLKRFRALYPKVEFKVTTGWSREVYHLVYNQEVHVGIVRGDYQWADAKRLLFEENVSIVSQEPFTLEELPRLPRIDYETDPLMKAILDNWWSRRYSQPPLIGMEVDKGDTCREMVVNGLGYGILSSALVDKDEDLYRLDIEDEQGKPVVRQTWMLYHEQSLEMKLIRAFVEFVEGVDFKQDL